MIAPTVPANNQPSHSSMNAAPTGTPLPNPSHTPSLVCLPLFWLSFSVHEHLNSSLGLPECKELDHKALAIGVMPDSEVLEFHSCRHAFPHVPQKLYPSVRPDGIPGQYLHLTQIPLDTEIVDSTGLSQSYQIIIRFDADYHHMTKAQVQDAAIARFAHMNIKLANRFREPVSAIVNRKTHGWLGFIRVDLLNPEIDAIALLKGHRVFTLQMQTLEFVVGKVEKGYEFLSTAANRRLQLTGQILTTYNSRNLLADLITHCYMKSAFAEVVGAAKKFTSTDSADVTVTSFISKQFLLNTPPQLHDEPVQVKELTLNADQPRSRSMDARSTSILVRDLNIQYSQIQVSAALHKLLGAPNIVAISYNRAQDDSLGRHDGAATIHCLNSAVYTTWCSRRAIPLLGKLVDFTLHQRSLAGSAPPANVRAHDNRPTREFINDAITALKNETPQGPTLSQVRDSLQAGVDNLQQRLTTLQSEVNDHTSRTMTAAATTQASQHAHLLQQLQLLSTASSNYSRHMSGISDALLAGPIQQHSPHINGLPAPQFP